MHLGHLVVRFFSQFWKSDMSKYRYPDVISESPLEFEITRADCIITIIIFQKCLHSFVSDDPDQIKSHEI